MQTDVTTKPCWAEDSKGHRFLCHDWNNCPGKEWYSMGDIQYCRHQVIYIIEDILDYQNNRYITALESWPAEPKDTGYDDTQIQRGFKSEAEFAQFRRITADVISRLERTGIEGRLLLLEIKNQKEIDPKVFSREARNALNYVAGWRTKLMRYSLWKKQRVLRHGNKSI